MAHNLNFNSFTGKHSFFSVQQPAWHGLGQIIKEYPTSEQAMVHAGLDFDVIKRPLHTSIDAMQFIDGELKEVPMNILVPEMFATVRTDTNQALGVVGKDYAVVQNRDAFSFFDSIVGGDGILYETAGALGNGERIFITAKLSGYIRVGDDDLIDKYLFLTTSHDGTGSITAAFTPVRIVCNNTLNAAMKNMSNCIKIRHTQGAKDRLEQAHRVMGISNKLADDMQEVFNAAANFRVNDAQMKKLIGMAMAPDKKQSDMVKTGKDSELSTVTRNTWNDVMRYHRNNSTQAMVTTEGTLFGMYNAVTGYFQNTKKYKDQESKVKSIFYSGTAQGRAQAAFDICHAVLKAGSVDAVLA